MSHYDTPLINAVVGYLRSGSPRYDDPRVAMAKSQFTGTRLALFLVIVGDPRAPKNPSIKRHADAVVKIARGKLEAENRRYQAAMEKARGGVPRSTYQGSASSSGV